MEHQTNPRLPEQFLDIKSATEASGFSMASDALTGTLLRTLAASKPGGNFLELGTGTGYGTSWILDGMDMSSTLTSIDNAAEFISIAQKYLGGDKRLKLETVDGETWVNANKSNKYDYIFADTWHGKYLMLEEVLTMLNPGGLYIIDDMIPQSNWPEGHHEKVTNLLAYLDSRDDLILTRQVWATGIVIAVKR